MEIIYGEKHIINLGNYENITIEFSVKDLIDLEQNSFDNAKEEVINKVKKVILEQKEKLKEKPNLTLKTQNKVLTEREKTIQDIQNKCIEIIKLNPSSKDNLKLHLSKYNVSKIADLNDHDIIDFKNVVDLLYEQQG